MNKIYVGLMESIPQTVRRAQNSLHMSSYVIISLKNQSFRVNPYPFRWKYSASTPTETVDVEGANRLVRHTIEWFHTY